MSDEAIKETVNALAGIFSSFMDEHGEVQPVEGLSRDEEPITVAEVKLQRAMSHSMTPPGTFVSVRPCDDKKTYLGIYLGDLQTTPLVAHSTKSQTLFVNCRTNPAMWVPDLNKVVWGYGSWWGEVASEEELRQISDADIDNVWYVKALKAISVANEEDAADRAETVDD